MVVGGEGVRVCVSYRVMSKFGCRVETGLHLKVEKEACDYHLSVQRESHASD